MDHAALARAGDANLASAWSALGRQAAFDLAEIDSLAICASGLPIAFFNGAFARRPTTNPDRAIADVIAFFDRLSTPYLLWVRSGADEQLLAAGRAAGLRDAGGPPAMGMPAMGVIPSSPPELDVMIASTADDLQAHRDVVVTGFGMPPEVGQRILGAGLLDDPDLAIVVGRVQDVAVTTALLARSGDTAGVYNVATLPGSRGRGYGEAATWAAIGEGARRGCTHAVLQSSEVGHPVYLRMGFVDVGRYVQLEGRPAGT